MASMRYENRLAGRMLAYMEARGISIPCVDYSLDNWEIAKTAMDFNIQGESFIDNIARLWKKEYLQKPSPQPRFYSSDIHKSFMEARDYLKLIEKIIGLSDLFWESIGGMPYYVRDAIEGKGYLSAKTISVFRVLLDLPVKHRTEFYVRLCHILNDWDAIALLGGRRHNYLWDIIES